jgi:hypothetical protein
MGLAIPTLRLILDLVGRAMLPLLAAALLLSPGAASLRWEHRALVEAPLETALELAFEDPTPCYGPEVRGEDGRDRILESRLAVAQRLGGLLLSASAILSTNLRSGVETDFGYAVALTWTASALSAGIEWFGGIGDPHTFVEPPCRHHYLAPALSWSFAPRWVARAQAAKGASPGSGDLIRVNLAYQF